MTSFADSERFFRLKPEVISRSSLLFFFFMAREGSLSLDGLGLNIVKCFVEAHGGNVWVEPGKCAGVTFGFIIPG